MDVSGYSLSIEPLPAENGGGAGIQLQKAVLYRLCFNTFCITIGRGSEGWGRKMWPKGLGLMLYNGARGLIYYSSTAARLIVSNGGIIATVAVTGYFYPEEAIISAATGVGISGATWLLKKVEQKYHKNLTNFLGKAAKKLPTSVSNRYLKTSYQLSQPQRIVSTTIKTNDRLSWVNESLFTELVSPLIEESIYRYGIQKGLTECLVFLRVPRNVAGTIATAIAAAFFAAGHDSDIGSKTFRDTLITGIGFGMMMHMHGLPGAVSSHAANNVGTRLQDALELKFS